MGATEELLMSMADEARDSGADEARDSVIAYLNVDPDTRKISVPYSETTFGVMTDKDSERKYFRCPRIVGDNLDLSQHKIYISYVSTNSNIIKELPDADGRYWCDDVAVDGDYITFSWKLSGNVFKSPGFVAFKVLACTNDGNINKTRWNTAPAYGAILMTVPDGDDIAERYPDIVTQLLERMDAVEAIATEEAMKGFVAEYMENHPVVAGATEEQAAQIEQNTQGISELKGDLVELSNSVDNSVYTDFVDGEGWNGTVGEKIKTSLYELVSKMSLVNARVGDKFRLVTYGVGGWANRYYELDENLIVLYVHTGSGLLDGVIEISNESTRYLAINKGNSSKFEFYRYNKDMADIAQNKADIAQNKADISTKISYHYEKGETIGEIKDGLFNINTKTIEATGDIYRYIELDVNLLDNLFLTGVSHNNASSYPFVVFVDANGNVLDIIKGDSNDAKFIDYNVIITNQDVKKLYINGSTTFIGAYKAKEVDVYERKVADATWYNEKVAEAVIDEQKKNPFAWRSFDKGVVVFTFDDSLSDIDLVESLSEEYGVPVCFSSIPSEMNNVTTATGTNKKVHEVLTIAEEHGNEVLCHSSVALSETSTDEEIYANFVTNKKLLEEYGYSVRGIIEAGSGGGELSFDTKRSEKYLRVMYEYSDHYGRNLGMPQYDTGRTYINRNTQNNHNVVDACERNKTLLIFATHSITDESTSSTNTSESILRDLMAYVKTKDVYLLTFKGVYDMFRSSELENKINQLLN